MFALLLIPALLGLALIVGDDSDDDITSDGEDFAPVEEDNATGETITTTLEAGENSFDGTGANDRVADTDEASAIDGGAGRDFIQAFGGADTIDGGTGNDTIFAGDGDDTATGGTGNDRIFLGDGDDVYFLEDDETTDRGNDFIRGGAGSDGIIDLNGSDTIYGDTGDDIIAAFGSGDVADLADTIDGGAGDDVLFGDNGDLMTGGEGEDIFAVINPLNVDTEASIITDFNPAEDALIAFVPEANGAFESVELEYDPSANALRAFWRGDEVAVLNNLTSADASSVDITLIDAEDLENAGFA